MLCLSRGLGDVYKRQGVFNSVCASLLPGLLKSFMTHYPQIEIEVYQGTYCLLYTSDAADEL